MSEQNEVRNPDPSYYVNEPGKHHVEKILGQISNKECWWHWLQERNWRKVLWAETFLIFMITSFQDANRKTAGPNTTGTLNRLKMDAVLLLVVYHT